MKEVLDRFLDGIGETRTEPREGEYLGEDGLLYCEKCRTPVQCRKEFLGKMRTLPCTCKCRQEEMERQKKETAARERMMYIQRLKSTGIQERHLLDWRFENAEEDDNIQKDVVAIPRSKTPERIKENIDIFEFELSAEEMAALTALDKNSAYVGNPNKPELVEMSLTW